MIRVLLADDHAIMRDGLQRLINDQPDMTVVGALADGRSVVPAAQDPGCDVLILDLSLPDRTGMQVLEQMSIQAPRVNVIILSMYPEDQLSLALIRQGAKAYLNKSRPPEELFAAIRRVATGKRYITDVLSDLAMESTTDLLPHQRLTSREYQVFIHLIEGLSVNEVANELSVSASTVSNHVSAIRTKLGASSVGDIVRYAARVGLV